MKLKFAPFRSPSDIFLHGIISGQTQYSDSGRKPCTIVRCFEVIIRGPFTLHWTVVTLLQLAGPAHRSWEPPCQHPLAPPRSVPEPHAGSPQSRVRWGRLGRRGPPAALAPWPW